MTPARHLSVRTLASRYRNTAPSAPTAHCTTCTSNIRFPTSVRANARNSGYAGSNAVVFTPSKPSCPFVSRLPESAQY
jgi:hypothetical protein